MMHHRAIIPRPESDAHHLLDADAASKHFFLDPSLGLDYLFSSSQRSTSRALMLRNRHGDGPAGYLFPQACLPSCASSFASTPSPWHTYVDVNTVHRRRPGLSSRIRKHGVLSDTNPNKNQKLRRHCYEAKYARTWCPHIRQLSEPAADTQRRVHGHP
ncbi:hypothetical protein BD309DRAFT_960695 [Dichomitus squalens]|nr:hypothetical protein BD309DRAFT_960695 [Dichomitus squalens]